GGGELRLAAGFRALARGGARAVRAARLVALVGGLPAAHSRRDRGRSPAGRARVFRGRQEEHRRAAAGVARGRRQMSGGARPVLALVPVWRVAAFPSAGAAAPLGHREVRRGGPRPLAAPRPAIPIVVVRAYVRAGSAFDPPGAPGLANLTAELLTRG